MHQWCKLHLEENLYSFGVQCSAARSCPCKHGRDSRLRSISPILHLQKNFTNLHGVESCALADLVAGEPQRVAVFIG